MAMKRLYTLFLIMCMAIGVADVAVAQDAPTQKTRYVYLWDVTSSIDKNLYEQMYDFLQKDVSMHNEEGTEMYIVPFNDKVIMSNGSELVFGYKVQRGELVTTSGGKDFSQLHEYGWEMVGIHRKNFKDKSEPGGYTDIADAVNFARKKYLSDNYNTIFILLTDGGQEYYTNADYVDGGNADSKKRLQDAIKTLDSAMGNCNSINMLFYVNFKQDSNNPKNGLSNLAYTEFIDADKSTPVIYFCPIKASLTAKKGTISSRDTQFGVRFDVPEGFTLPKDLKVTFNDGKYINYTADLKSSVDVALKSNAKFEVERDSTLTVPVRLSSEPKKVRNNSTIYVYWLDTEKLDLTVTNEFTPIVTVRLK